MINEKTKSLIEKLLEKTKANEVNWTQGSGNYSFQLILNSGSMSLDSFYDSDSDQQIISMGLYNDNGESIESIWFREKEDKDNFRFLESFYHEVKRKYLKVDETIDSFFEEINKEGKIGKKVKRNDIDDLPF